MLSIARRKRKPNLNGSEVPTTTFADVAGMESAKRELAEVGSWLLAERERPCCGSGRLEMKKW